MELRPLLRFFTLQKDQLPPNPWLPSFQAGTMISGALEMAQRMLERDKVDPASILLISDLETAPSDFTALGSVLSRIKRSDTTMRVVPLSATSDGRAFFGGILGFDSFVDPVEPNAGEARTIEVNLRGETPLLLLLASALRLPRARRARAVRGPARAACRRRVEADVRKHVFTVAAVAACLVVGTLMFLLALDVARLRSALPADDVRFRGAPEEQLWAPDQVVPGGIARTLLAVDDDIRFREAVRGVRLSHPEMPGFSDPSYVVHRNEATAWLTDIVQQDDDAKRQSAAANLLGVLSFADAVADYTNRGRLLEGATGRFRQAINLDPANDEAKHNLELTLSRARGLELSEAGGGNAPSPGGKGAKGAGAGDPGSGY